MSDDSFQPLVDGVRSCFPAITRSRVAISTSLTAHNGNIKLIRAIVALDERFPTFDVDGLMSLLDADEMTAENGRSTVKGRFEGKPCEIILIPQQPKAEQADDSVA